MNRFHYVFRAWLFIGFICCFLHGSNLMAKNQGQSTSQPDEIPAGKCLVYFVCNTSGKIDFEYYKDKKSVDLITIEIEKGTVKPFILNPGEYRVSSGMTNLPPNMGNAPDKEKIFLEANKRYYYDVTFKTRMQHFIGEETVWKSTGRETIRWYGPAFYVKLKTLSSEKFEKLVSEGKLKKYENQIWEPLKFLETSPLLRLSLSHIGAVQGLAFSPDSKILASSTVYGQLKIWDVASGRELTSIKVSTKSFTFSPNGKIIAYTDGNNIIIWEPAYGNWEAPGKNLKTLTGHTDKVNSIAFSPDGKTIASGSNDSTIKIWDTASGKLIASRKGHKENYCVVFSADGKSLFSHGSSGNIIWDTTNWQILNEDQYIITTKGFLLSPDGKKTALCDYFSYIGSNGIIIMDTTDEGKYIKIPGYKGQTKALAFSPDSRVIAADDGDRMINIYDVSDGKLLETLNGHSKQVTVIAFSPDGRTIASGSEDFNVKLWNVPDSIKPQTPLPVSSSGFISSEPQSRSQNQPQSKSKLVFSDDQYFTTTNGITSFNGGEVGKLFWNIPLTIPSNFAAKVAVRWDSGKTNNGFGIIFRLSEDRKNFYLFQVTGGRSYQLAKRENDHWKYLVNWQDSDFLKPGFNQLKVTCQGKRITCYINEKQVIDLEDVPPGASKMGIGIGVNDGIKCSFSDFEVSY